MNYCRVCLAQDENKEMVSIFEQNSKIAFEIFLIAEIKFIEILNKPALICQQCRKQLLEATKFRNKCKSSEGFLREKIFQVEKNYFKKLLKAEDQIVSHKAGEEECHERLHNIIDNTDERRESKKGSSDRKNDNSTEQCELCLKIFTSLHSLKCHMRAIHQKIDTRDMYRCEHCDRLFKMKYYLNRHIKCYHTKKISEKLNENKEKIITKNEEIFKQKLLKCPYCGKYLTSKHSLNDHIKVKHEFIHVNDRFLCDICGKDFPLKYYLLRHIRASHLKTIVYKKKENQSIPCSICGKILKNKGNLSTHEKTHKKLRTNDYWYCDLCGNKFKNKGEMTGHIKRQHLKKIKYPCKICPNKSWKTLFQLQRHIKVYHQNIREFKCEWCGKEFGEKNKLICHTRIHTGEQPFQCVYCIRKFTHQTDLRRHTWGHTGERPYKCEKESCVKGFMKKSELVAHRKRCSQPQAKTALFHFQIL